jgi:hypothetical protein
VLGAIFEFLTLVGITLPNAFKTSSPATLPRDESKTSKKTKQSFHARTEIGDTEGYRKISKHKRRP